MNSVAVKEDLLNFCYFSANFYNYVSESAKIFQNMKKEEGEKKNIENVQNLIKDNFDFLNIENYMNYMDNLSILHDDDINSKKYKIKVANSFIGNNFFQNENEKEKENKSIILYKLKEKFNMSILHNKFEYVKLISIQTISFLFDIYELIYNLFKNMEESSDEKIKKITTENLLSESELNISKKKLSKDIIDLKNKIEIQKQLLNKNELEKGKLIEKNNNLEKEIIKLKTEMKNLQNQIILSKNESNDKIKSLKLELKEIKKNESNLEKDLVNSNEKLAFLETKLRQSKEKITNLETELKESKEKIIFLEEELRISKEKLSNLENEFAQSNKESKEKFTLVQEELMENKKELKESKEKLSLLQEELEKNKKDSKEKLSILQEELEKNKKESKNIFDIFNKMKQEIESLKISNSYLNEKLEIAEGGYNHMKSLNTQIIFDIFKTKDENLEHIPEAHIDVNSLIRILNLMSIDYEAVNNKLREKEKEIADLKKEKKQK